MKRSMSLWTALIGAGLLATTANAATTYTWTAGVSGNWSNIANWDANGVPLSDVVNSDVAFNGPAGNTNVTATIDAAWNGSGSGSVHGLAFNNNVVNLNNYVFTLAGMATTNLTIGSGGISNNSGHRLSLLSATTQTFTLDASQIWHNSTAGDAAAMTLIGNLASAPGVVLTKTGPGQITFGNGNSTNFLGSFVWNEGNIFFGNQSQYARLGTQTVTANFAAASTSPTMIFSMTNGATPVNSTFANGMNLTVPGARILSLTMGSSYSAGQKLTMSGQWSGTLAGGSGSGFLFANLGFATWDDRFQYIFNQDNSGLTSAADPAVGNFAVAIRKSYVVADNPNALGLNNSLGVGIGENGSNVAGVNAGLLATSGNDVNAKIRVRNNTHTSALNEIAVLGLEGTGAVDFKSNIYLESSNTLAQVSTLKLTAPTGGTATFSGIISELSPANANFVPVLVLGTGDVLLSGNNTYKGGTIVRGGTLRVAHANALGIATSTISLGDTVSAPTGGDVVAATIVAPRSGTTTWVAGVYTFTTALNTLDGVALNPGDRVLVKDEEFDSQRHGIYIVSADKKSWTRAADLDANTEFLYGLKVHVTGGTANANKNFYLTNQTFTTAGVLNTTPAGFNPDASSSQDVALLTDGAFTVARNINVTDNLSTGKSTLGGNSAHASTFSGTVSLAKGLTVTAATNGSVDFSGDITGGFGVTKEGTGKVIFSAAKSYSGTTSVTDGILAVNSTLASSGVSVTGGTLQGTGVITNGVTVGALGTLAPGNSIGTLTVGSADIDGTFNVEVDGTGLGSADLLDVIGNLDITNAVLDLDILATLDDPAYIIASYGSLTGLQFASVLDLPVGYVVDYNYQGGNQIALVIPEPATLGLMALGGLMISIRRRKA